MNSPYRNGPDEALIQRVADLEQEVVQKSAQIKGLRDEVSRLLKGQILERASLGLAVLISVLAFVRRGCLSR
jgi:hypothetical protein